MPRSGGQGGGCGAPPCVNKVPEQDRLASAMGPTVASLSPPGVGQPAPASPCVWGTAGLGVSRGAGGQAVGPRAVCGARGPATGPGDTERARDTRCRPGPGGTARPVAMGTPRHPAPRWLAPLPALGGADRPSGAVMASWRASLPWRRRAGRRQRAAAGFVWRHMTASPPPPPLSLQRSPASRGLVRRLPEVRHGLGPVS